MEDCRYNAQCGKINPSIRTISDHYFHLLLQIISFIISFSSRPHFLTVCHLHQDLSARHQTMRKHGHYPSCTPIFTPHSQLHLDSTIRIIGPSLLVDISHHPLNVYRARGDNSDAYTSSCMVAPRTRRLELRNDVGDWRRC